MKIKVLIAILATVIITSTAVMAQHRQGRKADCPTTVKQRTEKITKMLSLDAAQQAKAEAIFTKQCPEMQKARTAKDTTLVKEIRISTHSQINAILTPEQQAKWAAKADRSKCTKCCDKKGEGKSDKPSKKGRKR